MDGRLINSFYFKPEIGMNYLKINGAMLDAGSYIMGIVDNGEVLSKKIIRLRVWTPKKSRSRQTLMKGIRVKIVDVEIGDAVLSASNMQIK